MVYHELHLCVEVGDGRPVLADDIRHLLGGHSVPGQLVSDHCPRPHESRKPGVQVYRLSDDPAYAVKQEVTPVGLQDLRQSVILRLRILYDALLECLEEAHPRPIWQSQAVLLYGHHLGRSLLIVQFSHSLINIIACPIGNERSDISAEKAIVPRQRCPVQSAYRRHPHQDIHLPQSKGGRGRREVSLSHLCNAPLQASVKPEMSMQ